MEVLGDIDVDILYNPTLLAKEINRLEKRIKTLSAELKFEEAIKVRDKLLALKEKTLKV